jgi:penicillin-binding protein 1A
MSYMQKVLKDVPTVERPVPDGLIQVGGDYYYAENPPGTGVKSLGLSEPSAPTEEEKIKDDVRNELF